MFKVIAHKTYTKRSYLLLLLVPLVSFLLLLQTETALAGTTCTQSGDTTYCSDPTTGQSTTYNQYGDNIYGSDGSSYTIYNDPFSGGSSGSNVPSLGNADMDSPEMKAATAKHEEACGNNTGASGEVLIGGTQARECREAYIEWLEAVTKSSNENTSNQPNSYDDYSDDGDKDMDEWTRDMLERYGITDESSQPEDLCITRGVANSHQVGNMCECDTGYFIVGSICLPVSNENCKIAYGEGVVVNGYGDTSCKCGAGYTYKSTDNTCFPNSTVASDNATYSAPVQQSLVEIQNVPTDFKVEQEDISPLSQTGNINTESRLRKCPSIECSVVGTYNEGTMVEIIGKYKKDTWLNVKVINLGTGWIYKPLVDVTVNPNDSSNGSGEPVRMTASEYEAKYDVKPDVYTRETLVIQGKDEATDYSKQEKVSWFKKVLNWFGF